LRQHYVSIFPTTEADNKLRQKAKREREKRAARSFQIMLLVDFASHALVDAITLTDGDETISSDDD
jgi:hypothetical protein